MSLPVVLIVTPYAPAANNGNVRTAERWARLLESRYRVIVRTPAERLDEAALLIALHARRSHGALRAWRDRAPSRPAILVLTGTDLYGDIPGRDAKALESLEIADRLIVLQERGVAALPERFRHKACVIFQSSPALPPYAKSDRRMRVLFVGHLRAEKDPVTFVRAAASLRGREDIEFAIVGSMRDPTLEATLQPLLASAPNVRMIGPLSHAATRQRIRRAHLLVVSSLMEGGANVIVEAAVSGTAVLASGCDGNLGMLGADYPGVFAVHDHVGLARLIDRCRTEPAFHRHLAQICTARAPLFSPEAEQRGLLGVVAPLIAAVEA